MLLKKIIHDYFLILISNILSHIFPVTKIEFLFSLYAIPLITSSFSCLVTIFFRDDKLMTASIPPLFGLMMAIPSNRYLFAKIFPLTHSSSLRPTTLFLFV